MFKSRQPFASQLFDEFIAMNGDISCTNGGRECVLSYSNPNEGDYLVSRGEEKTRYIFDSVMILHDRIRFYLAEDVDEFIFCEDGIKCPVTIFKYAGGHNV